MSIKNQYKPLKTAKKGLKILYLHGCTGSSPVPSTKEKRTERFAFFRFTNFL